MIWFWPETKALLSLTWPISSLVYFCFTQLYCFFFHLQWGRRDRRCHRERKIDVLEGKNWWEYLLKMTVLPVSRDASNIARCCNIHQQIRGRRYDVVQWVTQARMRVVTQTQASSCRLFSTWRPFNIFTTVQKTFWRLAWYKSLQLGQLLQSQTTLYRGYRSSQVQHLHVSCFVVFISWCVSSHFVSSRG